MNCTKFLCYVHKSVAPLEAVNWTSKGMHQIPQQKLCPNRPVMKPNIGCQKLEYIQC